MARLGVSYETVKQTAVKLLSQGMAPSVQKIREELGTGSNTTIAEHLKIWREEYAKKTIHHLPANIPKELISTFEVLWQTAMEQAQNQLAEYKQTLDNERKIILQTQHDAERAVGIIKQQLAETTVKLEQEISNKQELSIELAIVKDSLAKLDEALIAQKVQHDDRLKRVYEEKDSILTQYYQLQNEVKTLQEKLTSQAEQHQNILIQQNVLHEQSEIRWLKFIDQAKLEVKETHKKLKNVHLYHSDKIKNLENELGTTQQDLQEKHVQITINLERINQLKKEIKLLETDYLKTRSTTKLEKQKVVFNSPKNKSRKRKIHANNI